MSSQRQKPIDFATEGLRLALPVDRNCGIPVETTKVAGKRAIFNPAGTKPEKWSDGILE